VNRVRALRRKGKGIISIAKAVGVGTSTVQRIVAA
jgi:transposase